MLSLLNYLSALLGNHRKFNKLKQSVNCHYSLSSYLGLAAFFVLANFSAHAQSSQNDSDGDGLKDAYELKIGLESYLSDTDGDTIKDAEEVGKNKEKPLDTDNDGVIDALDYDDDNDGLPTYLETKNDSDKDGLLDYLDSDSDNDGITDGEEAGFLNQDKNLDGIDDAFDTGRKGAVDTNGDGIDDNVKLPDHNNDGKPDYLDAKFQHHKLILVKKEKIKNKIEIIDKKPPKTKQIDTKKVVVTAVEPIKTVTVEKKQKSVKSSQVDNMIINRHTDSDNDGLSNALEKILGTNHLSRDSDNDKVSDAIEIGLDVNSPQDSDHDGIIDALDNDDDNDGILTKLEDLNKDSTAINDDTDQDGVPNYLDANDDGDNLLTKAEGSVADSDGDGILDYLDKNDGIKDQSNALNTMRVTEDNAAPVEPEIVVLFDGDAAALVAEEEDALKNMADSSADSTSQNKSQKTSQDIVQNDILNSLEEILQNESLDDTDQNNISESSNEEDAKIQTSRSSSKPVSHWNLF